MIASGSAPMIAPQNRRGCGNLIGTVNLSRRVSRI